MLLVGAVSTSLFWKPERASQPQPRHEILLRVDTLAELVTKRGLLRELPHAADLGVERIVAFEENWAFLYLCGVSGQEMPSGNAGQQRPDGVSSLVRRILLIKPSTLLIDDHVHLAGKSGVAWTLHTEGPLVLEGRAILDAGGEHPFRCRTLMPESGTWQATGRGKQRHPGGHASRLLLNGTAAETRLLHLMEFGPPDPAARPNVVRERDGSSLHVALTLVDELMSAERQATLWLPKGTVAGKIGITLSDGNVELPRRLLPAGILPLGEDALRLREGWDLAYRVDGLATWDTGRPSSQLKQAVDRGMIRPCRVVELGCGSGNDAIYLAGKGFDVTAIDVAPTALTIAEEKARKAGVKVNWLLADVLRPPELGSFDLVYDRACYHEVRRHDAEGYVRAARQLTHPGARVLILAGNANKDRYWRFHGPPRVKEEEIRGDFRHGFTLLELQPFRFDPVPPDREGALAWSVLLKREGPGRNATGW